MWPFSRPLPPPHPEIVALRADLDALKRTVRDVQTDWDQTYEKFQRLNATLAQRWKRLVAAEDERGGPGEATAGGSGADHPGSADSPQLGITNPLALELLKGARG
jgi:hypothetical protein